MRKVKSIKTLEKLLMNYDKVSQNNIPIELDHQITNSQVNQFKKQIEETIGELRMVHNE